MSVHVFEPRPRRRVRRWTAGGLRDIAYDGAIAFWGFVCLGVLVGGVSVTASLVVFVVGVPVWLALVYLIRATTSIDRRLVGWQRGESVPARYRRAPGGFLPLLKTLSTDPQTWKDVGWVSLNSVVGTALGLIGLTSLGVAGEFLSLPLRYWAAGPVQGYGPLHATMAVDSAGKALLAGAVGVALIPIALLIARACAAAHAELATRFLAPGPSGPVIPQPAAVAAG